MNIFKRLYERIKRKFGSNINLKLVLASKKECVICNDGDIDNGIYICKRCTLKIIDKTVNIDIYLDKYRDDTDVESNISVMDYDFENN